jgi:phage baseplate assembly protein W
VNVRESIWIILTTELGERVYRTTFGCRLGELVFAPLNSQTLLLTRLYVEEALQTWEPWIILDGVLTQPEAELVAQLPVKFWRPHLSPVFGVPIYLLMFVMLQFSAGRAGVKVVPIATPPTQSVLATPGLADLLFQALERGTQVNTDLTERWDFGPDLAQPLDRVRERLMSSL